MRVILTGTKKVRSTRSYNNNFNLKCLEHKTVFLSRICENYVYRHNSIRNFHFTNFLNTQDVTNKPYIENIISSKNIMEDSTKLMEEISKFHAIFKIDLEHIVMYIRSQRVDLDMEFLSKMNLEYMLLASEISKSIHVALSVNIKKYGSCDEIKFLHDEFYSSLSKSVLYYKSNIEANILNMNEQLNQDSKAISVNIPKAIEEICSHMEKIEKLYKILPKYIDEIVSKENWQTAANTISHF